VWGRKGADIYLLDQERGRMDCPATIQAVRRLHAKWPQAKAKLVEDKANGSAVIAMLKHEIEGLIAVNPEGGKESRVHAVTPQIEAGNVYLPEVTLAPWVGGFIEECAAFPNGAYDDQVDAMTQALVRLGRAKPKLDYSWVTHINEALRCPSYWRMSNHGGY
jgi:predicted phage terminase large subunit-like protein